jgi:hypothetical protein
VRLLWCKRSFTPFALHDKVEEAEITRHKHNEKGHKEVVEAIYVGPLCIRWRCALEFNITFPGISLTIFALKNTRPAWAANYKRETIK